MVALARPTWLLHRFHHFYPKPSHSDLVHLKISPPTLSVAPPYIAISYRIAHRLWTKVAAHKPASGRFHLLLFAFHHPHTHTPLWFPNLNQNGGYTKSEPSVMPSTTYYAPCLTLEISTRSQLDFLCRGDALWYSVISFFRLWVIFNDAENRGL